MSLKAELFTDGGARGNPGPAGIGAVLRPLSADSLMPPQSLRRYIGTATNNQAEYHALLAGLEMAAAAAVTDLKVYLDSELIVKQLRGEYKVKNADLKPLFAEVLRRTNRFSRISWHHIPREKNKSADKLVNEALDKQAGVKKKFKR
jgi:ribonuclease HI